MLAVSDRVREQGVCHPILTEDLLKVKGEVVEGPGLPGCDTVIIVDLVGHNGIPELQIDSFDTLEVLKVLLPDGFRPDAVEVAGLLE